MLKKQSDHLKSANANLLFTKRQVFGILQTSSSTNRSLRAMRYT
jgi:hypothetical protein